MYHKETLESYCKYLDLMIIENKRFIGMLDNRNGKSYAEGFNHAYELIREGIEGFFESTERIIVMGDERREILEEMEGD